MKALVITGSMGSGKTTLIGEISDLLAMRGVAHAAIDIDAFGNAHDPPARSTSRRSPTGTSPPS